jgi:hypothetical protein
LLVADFLDDTGVPAVAGTSVPDPDPNPDPHVFGPFGSGSFYHAKIVRKTLIPTIL